MNFLFTTTLTVLLAFAGNTLASNASAFQAALEATRHADRMIREGATDTDCVEIDAIMIRLATLRPLLTEAQQRVIWSRAPYWAGIACNWKSGQAWVSNDCAFRTRKAATNEAQ